VPLDWTQSNKDLLLRRLSPDGTGAGESFADARYFHNSAAGGNSYLELRSPGDPATQFAWGQRPLLPSGATPLGWALSDYRDWYCEGEDPSRSCKNPATTGGWQHVAAVEDPFWGCRQHYRWWLPMATTPART
jgi:hypothetical protein